MAGPESGENKVGVSISNAKKNFTIEQANAPPRFLPQLTRATVYFFATSSSFYSIFVVFLDNMGRIGAPTAVIFWFLFMRWFLHILLHSSFWVKTHRAIYDRI
jgi:hypothetical protein